MENQTTSEPVVRLRVPQEFKEEIEAMAEEMHISVSALTRLALGDYIRQRKAEGVTPEPKEAA